MAQLEQRQRWIEATCGNKNCESTEIFVVQYVKVYFGAEKVMGFHATCKECKWFLDVHRIRDFEQCEHCGWRG